MRIDELKTNKTYYYLRLGYDSAVVKFHMLDVLDLRDCLGGTYKLIYKAPGDRLCHTERCVYERVLSNYRNFNEENHSVLRFAFSEYLSKDKASLLDIIRKKYLYKDQNRYLKLIKKLKIA